MIIKQKHTQQRKNIPPSLRCYLLVFCIIFITSGCNKKTVYVTSHKDFSRMTHRIGPVLEDRGIIVDQCYYEPFFSPSLTIDEKNIGAYLYTHLSPIFQEKTYLHPSTTFKKYKKSNDTLTIYNLGFVLQKKNKKTITTKLIAQLDWDPGNPPAWLLLCRVEAHTPKKITDYYLIVHPDKKASILVPKPIAICNALTRKGCIVLVKPITNSDSTFGTNNFIEVDPGSYSIITPPNKTQPSHNNDHGVQEQRLLQ